MVGKIGPVFPMIGKNFREFSNEWKKCFQWLENRHRAELRLPKGEGWGYLLWNCARISRAPGQPANKELQWTSF
jgi:hypothetical protein